MKKLLCSILIICILLFAGCSPQAPEPIYTAPTPAVRPSAEVIAPSTTAPAPTPEPTPEPDALTADEGIYTIGWVSDTQHYSAKYPQTYYDMTKFLAENRDRLNLGYIIHTGDLVHNFDIPEQWQIADSAMKTIDHIPHGVLAGNHDVGTSLEDYSVYKQFFGENRYTDKPWYGGSMEDNRCHYDLITLGNTDYLFVYVGYAPKNSHIKWANEIFAQYPDRIGVLCLHDYFNTDTTLTEDGIDIYNKIVKKNPNLYMVLCGHRYTQYAETLEMDDDGDGSADRKVHQVIANYQAAGSEGGSGYMRFMQIDEAAGIIRMYSYTPVYDDYIYFDTPERLEEKYASDAMYEEYQIDIPWKPAQE